MKNRLLKLSALSLIVAVVFSFFSINAFAETSDPQYVYDIAYLLNDEELARLNTIAAETSEKYGCAVHFVITDETSVNYNNIQQYSEDLYLYSDLFGYGPDKDGVMLVLGTYDRCYWLLAYGNKGNFAFTDYSKDWMSERFVSKFANNDWYGGMLEYIECCDYILSKAETGKPVDVYYDYEETDIGVEAYGIALVAGLVLAIILCGIFSAQMKTAKIATNASSYVTGNGLEITGRYDHLLHTSVSRTKIESSSSSGHSGSSRGGTSVSSRGFSGKGGRF